MGKSSTNGPFSIAMLNNQRVNEDQEEPMANPRRTGHGKVSIWTLGSFSKGVGK